MSGLVLDSVGVDHPDPDAERVLSLELRADGNGEVGAELRVVEDSAAASEGLVLERESPRVVRLRAGRSVDLERLESWDAVFALAGGGAESLTIELRDGSRLPALFHAACTWLGLFDGPLRAVRLILADGAEAGIEASAATFADEKARHLEPSAMDLPAVDWLAEEHQFSRVAAAAWDFAVGVERPPELSVRQVFAIRLYTTEFYLAFHRALRAGRGDDPVYRAMRPLIACFDAGLENLPALPGRSYRGERFDSYSADGRRALRVGDSFEELSYLSSSTDELHAAAMRRGFLFRIDGRRGRDISPFSPFPWEREVLFPRGLVQRVRVRDCSERSIAEECDFDTADASISRFDASD